MTAAVPGSAAHTRRQEMLAEIEHLREQRHEATLGPVERRWRERRLMTIPLYADGMVTPEVAQVLGVPRTTVEGWAHRDPEIRWWAQAAFAGRRWVLTMYDTQEKRRQRDRVRGAAFRARHTANRRPDGTVPEAPHGKALGYVMYGCRCRACSAAHSAELQRMYAARLQRTADNGGVAPVPAERHGSLSTYNGWGCRCATCCATVAARRRPE